MRDFRIFSFEISGPVAKIYPSLIESLLERSNLLGHNERIMLSFCGFVKFAHICFRSFPLI
jgi:hypothetical protein